MRGAGEVGDVEPRLGLEVECARDVARVGLAPRQRAQSEAVADHLQDRLKPVDAVVDIDAARAADVAYPRGADVVKEAAPLVVDDEQRAALELRRLHERVHDIRHERLAGAHVAVRVLIARGALVLPRKGRVDKAERRPGPAGAALVVLLHLPRARQARGKAP